ncbi:MAG: MBL fold metallo-hydrolase [Acidobacteriota bacterium]
MDQGESQGTKQPGSGCDHSGIFTVAGPLPIQSAWRDITYEPVRDNVWTASEGIYRTLFLKGTRGVIAFDTFSTPGGARAYKAAIERVFPDSAIHTLVYSHDHLDHTGYAADLAPQADILAHELCANVVRARESDGQMPATQIWKGERQEFRLDGARFELIYPGPTHGDGNTAVYLPQSRLLFMVDTVIPGVGYTFFPDWHLTPYIQTMRRFLSLEWDTFIPGHFWPMNRNEFQSNLYYYEMMAETAQRAIAQGVDVENLEEVTCYARERLKPQFGHLFRFEEYAALNLMRYMVHYLTGGWGIEGNMEAKSDPL